MKKLQIILVSAILLLLMFSDIVKADSSYDEIEKKTLTEWLDVQIKDFFNGDFSDDLNDYVEDQIAFKKLLRELKSITKYHLQLSPENNGIYVSGEHLFERVFPKNDKAIDKYLETIKRLEEKFNIDEHFVIPDKSLYLDEFLHLNKSDFEELNLLFDLFDIDDFYKTDLHLSHQGAYKLYHHLVKDALSLDFKEVSQDFQGYYYNKSMYSLLKDSIYQIDNDLVKNLTICKLDDCYDSVYFDKELEGHDKYTYFSGGVSPITTITNPNGEGELVIFGDSYSQSLSIFMALNYAKVTVVDLRLININEVEKYIGSDYKAISVYGLKTINDGSITN